MKRIIKISVIAIIMLIVTLILTGCDDKAQNNKSNSDKTNSSTSATKSQNEEHLIEAMQDKEDSDSTKSKNNESAESEKSDSQSKNSEEQIDIKSIDFVSYAKKQVEDPQEGETIAIIHIKDYGDIKIKFFKDAAPKAVENFIEHSKEGYYNGQIFHRVINDFMIQGGDPTGTGTGGESIWGKNFEDEFTFELAPYRGALCMANSGANTNGSQFFIEQARYNEDTEKMLIQYGYPENLLEAYKIYGGSMHLMFAHTVFGQVIEGMDVVDKIAATKTDENDKPIEDVVIESIEITEYGK